MKILMRRPDCKLRRLVEMSIIKVVSGAGQLGRAGAPKFPPTILLRYHPHASISNCPCGGKNYNCKKYDHTLTHIIPENITDRDIQISLW